ncbi:MAG: lipid A 1-phosphatase LpxE [Hydrogenobaculum sp.]
MVFELFKENIELFDLINHHHDKFFDRFFYTYASFGSGWVLLPFLAYIYTFRRYKLKVYLVALIIETILVTALKNIFDQPRPASVLKHVHLLYKLYWGSFPSGDTAMAFVVAMVGSYNEKPLVKAFFFSYAFLIMYERSYVGVHFPLDTITGALIGVISFYVAKALVDSSFKSSI